MDLKREYELPRVRSLGTFAGLTMGNNGSCPDGGSQAPDQRGGASTCGVSGEATGNV